MDTECKTAREYLRVSQDTSGRARSLDEQHDENEAAAGQHGFRLNGEAYADLSVSASRYSRKVRGDFARLLADIEHGRFGADVLVMWESSRGSRRVGEWASLVDKLEDAGITVHVTTHGRTYDPANHRDRRTLMEDAVDSEYESGKASARVLRAMAANAAGGKPHGQVLYGYRREYEVLPNGRRVLLAQLPDDNEAPVIRELFGRLRGGHSLRSIAADFEDRGIRSRSGKALSPQYLRELALRPAYGGYRTHVPGSRGGGVYKGPLDGAVQAAWPALVDAETFHAVRAILLAPERRTSRPGRGVHLLSMIAACDVCGGVLTARNRRGERMYVCRERYCVMIGADDLDGYAVRIMTAYLARPDVISQLRDTAADDDGQLSQIRAELAQARAELASLRDAGRALRVTVATVLAMEPGLVARVEGLEARERELLTPPALSVIPPGADVAARWDAAPMPARRQAARLLCSPAILGTLRVGRSPAPGHHADPEQRVRWDRSETGRDQDA